MLEIIMMKNPKILAKIQQGILDGRQAGITGTPTVFLMAGV
jgi:protein-disulfide isomerase